MSELSTDLRAKVLIAEDDAIVALDLQGMVMRLGYDVVSIVDSGQAAIASARRFQPDIILLDIVLSGSLDGIDVAREIQKEYDVPVIFCITSPDLALLSRTKEITYAGYLVKPINPDSLATTLDTALYKYKLEKRVRNAEEKFRKYVESCGIQGLFLDRGLMWRWNRANPSAPVIHDIPEAEASDALAGKIREAADACVASGMGQGAYHAEIALGDGSKRMFAILALQDGVEGSISGLVIPIEGLA